MSPDILGIGRFRGSLRVPQKRMVSRLRSGVPLISSDDLAQLDTDTTRLAEFKLVSNVVQKVKRGLQI